MMNYLLQYTIPFSGLSEGKHTFDFEVDDRFFAEFEASEVEKGGLAVRVELEKRSTYLSLNFFIHGNVELVCDRCLENFISPLESTKKLLVKFSDRQMDEEDELIYLPHSAFEIEIAQYIYEFVILSLPFRRIHPDGDNGESLCDPVMLKKLEELRHHDTSSNEAVDPRWKDLKKFSGN